MEKEWTRPRRPQTTETTAATGTYVQSTTYFDGVCSNANERETHVVRDFRSSLLFVVLFIIRERRVNANFDKMYTNANKEIGYLVRSK